VLVPGDERLSLGDATKQVCDVLVSIAREISGLDAMINDLAQRDAWLREFRR
jgi:hypothetical protein